MTTITRILCLIASIGLAACEQANIVAPADNAVDTSIPTNFEVSFTGGSTPSMLKLQMNSADVTDLFTVTAEGATADGSALSDYIYSGRNVFRVTAGTDMKQVIFYHDTTGPQIRILSTDRNAMTVTGYVYDPGGVQSVTLDGVNVTLDANQGFTTGFSNLAFNEFVATDNFGQTRTTTFARNDRSFNGLSAYLSQGGLDFLTPVLEDTLSGANLDPVLSLLDIVRINIPGILSVDVQITGLALDNLDLDLALQADERLDVGLYAENLEASLRLSNFDLFIDIFGLLKIINVGATVTTTTDGSGKNFIDAATLLDMSVNNGNIDLGTANTALELSGLHIELEATRTILDDFFSDIISALLNVILDLFSDLILTLVDHLVVPLVSQFLSELTIDLSLPDLDGKGSALMMNAQPDYLDTTAQGLSVRLGTNVYAPTPATYVPTSLGSLYVDGIAPIMPTTTPDGSTFDFGVALSSNVLNQILVAAHDSGLTTINLGPGIYPIINADGTTVLNNAILEGDLIGVRLTPSSAPYVTLGNAGEGAAGTLYWYDVSLALDIYREEWGEYRPIFGATLNIEVPFGVNATFGGYLGLELDQVPVIEVTKTDASGILPIPAGFITNTVEFVVPAVLPMLANALQAIPLPRIFNHTLYMEEFWVEGGTGNNNTLALAGRLIPVDLVETAEAPITNIGTITYSITTLQMESIVNGSITTTYTDLENGAVDIAVSGYNPNPEFGGLQYRYQIDGGGWSAWKERTTVELTNFLAGDHRVKICARSALMKEEAEASCPVVEFTTSEVVVP